MSDGVDVDVGSVCATDPVTARIEELQVAVGEGPGLEAHQLGRAVLEPDLDGPHPRWPSFNGPAVDMGVRAMFSFPLRVGAVRLGALNLHSDRAGQLKSEQHLDALTLADIVADAIVLLEADLPHRNLAAALHEGANSQAVVSQASGIAAVQLNVTVGQALVRMRVYAFSNGRPLAEVAREVVARTLRFDGGNPLSNWLRQSEL